MARSSRTWACAVGFCLLVQLQGAPVGAPTRSAQSQPFDFDPFLEDVSEDTTLRIPIFSDGFESGRAPRGEKTLLGAVVGRQSLSAGRKLSFWQS